jgi:outer membrane murein-binding lipoprotein Lpp
MGTISRITTFSAGSVLTAAQLNNEFDNILSTANGNLNAANLGVTAGIAAASKALVLDASRDLDDSTGGNQIRNLALAGTLSVTGNADFDGVTNLDAVDIDGAVQLDSTLTVGANDQGYDVILYGDAASANLTWDTSVDDLIWNGAARAVIPDSQLVLGSTAVTTTGAEINLIDGGTSRGTTAVASGDGILINDDGTMRMTNVDTVSTYFSSHNVGGTNIVTVGTIGTGTWQGTAIASAYLDSDTAHLSGTQTFSGAKTFSAAATLATGSTVGNLTLANGSITDSSGSISMGDENLSTTGTLAAGATTIGGTLDFNSGTIDLSTQTVDVTLNAAVDALNFDSNTLSIDASNNRVGIGEAAPGALLHLKKNNGSAAIRMEREDTSVASGNEIGGLIMTGGESSADTPVARIVTYADDTWTSSSSPTRIEFEVTPSGATADVLAMTLDSTGNVGIGTAAPISLLHLHTTTAGPTALTISNSNADANGAYLKFSKTSASPADNDIVGLIDFYGENDNDQETRTALIYSQITDVTDGNEDGNLVFKTWVGGSTLNHTMTMEGGSVNLPNLSASSDVQTDGSKNLVTTSDERLKNADGFIKNALSTIEQLTPRYFFWKHDVANGVEARQLGFFSQEVHALIPEAAPVEDDIWGLNTRALVAYLTAAVQELSAKINKLEN